MQCKTDDCTHEAVAKIIFPWSAGEGETVVCQTHLEAAKQLMTNLNRSAELQVLPLVAPGVEVVEATATPAPVPVPPPDPETNASRIGLAQPRPSEERLTHQLRAQCLALELDLEKQRGARIAAELELVREGRAAFDHFATTVKDFFAKQLPELVAQFKEVGAEAIRSHLEEEGGGSVVDGATSQERPTPPDPLPAVQEAPPPPPSPDAPPHAP